MRHLAFVFSIAFLGFAGLGSSFCAADPQQPALTMQSMTVPQLEQAGDQARAQKDYEQAITYFQQALKKEPKNARLYNKLGLAQLSRSDYEAAHTDFLKATKYNRKYPEAWNDLGVVTYIDHDYKTAEGYFKKALALDPARASFHVNLGVTYFARNEVDRAMGEYMHALELDPDALVHSSSVGMSAQIADREERAKHDYMLAEIYAKLGNLDRCLVCLQNAKDNGYGDLSKVYKNDEFSALWRDPRLATIVPPPTAK